MKDGEAQPTQFKVSDETGVRIAKVRSLVRPTLAILWPISSKNFHCVSPILPYFIHHEPEGNIWHTLITLSVPVCIDFFDPLNTEHLNFVYLKNFPILSGTILDPSDHSIPDIPHRPWYMKDGEVRPTQYKVSDETGARIAKVLLSEADFGYTLAHFT